MNVPEYRHAIETARRRLNDVIAKATAEFDLSVAAAGERFFEQQPCKEAPADTGYGGGGGGEMTPGEYAPRRYDKRHGDPL